MYWSYGQEVVFAANAIVVADNADHGLETSPQQVSFFACELNGAHHLAMKLRDRHHAAVKTS